MIKEGRGGDDGAVGKGEAVQLPQRDGIPVRTDAADKNALPQIIDDHGQETRPADEEENAVQFAVGARVEKAVDAEQPDRTHDRNRIHGQIPDKFGIHRPRRDNGDAQPVSERIGDKDDDQSDEQTHQRELCARDGQTVPEIDAARLHPI